MDKKDLKKLLAGLSIAGLIGGAGLSMGGCAATAWSGEKQSGAGGTETTQEAPAQQPAGGSGWGGSK